MTTTAAPDREHRPASDVETLEWAADFYGISKAGAYRLAQAGKLVGAFKVGSQWRISVRGDGRGAR